MNAYLIETVKDLKNLNLKKNDIILCHNITTFYKTNRNKKYFFSIKFGKKKKFLNELFLIGTIATKVYLNIIIKVILSQQF